MMLVHNELMMQRDGLVKLATCSRVKQRTQNPPKDIAAKGVLSIKLICAASCCALAGRTSPRRSAQGCSGAAGATCTPHAPSASGNTTMPRASGWMPSGPCANRKASLVAGSRGATPFTSASAEAAARSAALLPHIDLNEFMKGHLSMPRSIRSSGASIFERFLV